MCFHRHYSNAHYSDADLSAFYIVQERLGQRLQFLHVMVMLTCLHFTLCRRGWDRDYSFALYSDVNLSAFLHCAGEAGTSLLSMTEELAAYLHNQTGLVTPAQRASNSNSDSDSGTAPSNSRQQASSAETQTGGEQVGRLKVDHMDGPVEHLFKTLEHTQEIRDFFARVKFQCRLSNGVHTPPCAIACINIRAQVKNSVVHARV